FQLRLDTEASIGNQIRPSRPERTPAITAIGQISGHLHMLTAGPRFPARAGAWDHFGTTRRSLRSGGRSARPGRRDGLAVWVPVALRGDQRAMPGDLLVHMDWDASISHPGQPGMAQATTCGPGALRSSSAIAAKARPRSPATGRRPSAKPTNSVHTRSEWFGVDRT